MFHGPIENQAAPDLVSEDEHDMEEGDGKGALVELIQPDSGFDEDLMESPPESVGESDFVDFYGFIENPFSDSVNPAYFYKTDQHEESYIRLMLAVRHNISLGLLTGLSGTGKTLVSQMVLQNLDPNLYEAALVLVSPHMSKTALLREILNELSIDIPAGPVVRAQDLLKLIGDRVMDLHETGRKLVILIDECHFLTSDSLHMIRTLSNIELPEKKLITCLLFAEDRFLKRIEHPSYESLKNRMYLQSHLEPMTEEECEQYVKFRLLVGGRTDPLFEEDALKAVRKASGGIGRRVNRLCMLALLEGFLRRRSSIDRDMIERCAKEL